jgi:aminoglycoside phosphotransferase (APT) family kinase protein
MSRLHAVDYQEAGLGEFARPGNYIERQLKRLGAQSEAESPPPALVEVRRRLERAVPPMQPQAVVHGDYGVHNVILSDERPGEVAAVLDWELAAIGDPLADLGWMMSMWAKSDVEPPPPSGSASVTLMPGFWTREQMVAEYGRLSGRDMTHYEYYFVFGLFKLVVIWQGIDARFRAGVTRGEGFEAFAARIPEGADRALAAADRSSIRALRGEG